MGMSSWNTHLVLSIAVNAIKNGQERNAIEGIRLGRKRKPPDPQHHVEVKTPFSGVFFITHLGPAGFGWPGRLASRRPPYDHPQMAGPARHGQQILPARVLPDIIPRQTMLQQIRMRMPPARGEEMTLLEDHTLNLNGMKDCDYCGEEFPCPPRRIADIQDRLHRVQAELERSAETDGPGYYMLDVYALTETLEGALDLYRYATEERKTE